MDALFEEVREAASPAIWSRGVELARRDAVSREPDSEGSVVARVATRGGLVAPRVHLHVREVDWECECGGPDDPCDHVAAAVIALRRAADEGRSLDTTDSSAGHIGYRLTRLRGELAFARVVVIAGEEHPLRGSLMAVAAGKVDGPAFVATNADLAVEKFLGGRLHGVFPPPVMVRLLGQLAACDDVQLDGRAVEPSLEPLLPIAVVVDSGDGFALRIERDPGVDETFQNGLALCGAALRPIGEPRLSIRERDELVRGGRYFSPDDVHVLVSEILPALERRVPIDVRTRRLPRAQSTPPRVRLRSERRGDQLVVTPEIVYGDPATARVELGKLVPLGGPLPLRDLRAEARLSRALSAEALTSGRALALDPADAIAFVAAPPEGMQFEGDGHAAFFRADPLEAGISLDGGFEVTFRGVGGGALDPAPVLRAWEGGASLFALPGGGFAPLPLDWLNRNGELVADLLAARDARGDLPTAAMFDLAKLCDALGEPSPPDFAALRDALASTDGLPALVAPADLEAELRAYQETGVRWLQFLRSAGLGGLLADDMGLGKTLQALCAIDGRTLVVAPTSVLPGWEEQIARFRPGLSVCTYHGPTRELDPAADVTLTTYAVLRLDIDRLRSVRWRACVLDEAQAIKNPDSQVARAAYQLQAEFRFTLTGTPVENRLDELWSQMNFVNPGVFGSRDDFRKRYSVPIDGGNGLAAERLRQRLRPFVLRRLKSEVATELPPRTESTLYCELDSKARAVYDAVRAAARRDVVERLRAGGSVLEALEALLRLRQAACHPALVPGHSSPSSSKIEVLVEMLEVAAAEGHHALVFSQWTSFLDLIEGHLEAADLGFVRLDGSTRDRGAVVARFQADDGPPVMLLSLRAGGTGLNLTAADHVFLMDPWWNPAVESQAMDRAHRIGQDRPVSVYRLVARDTVEESILLLQERKRALAAAALDGADAAGGVSREELLALLD